MENLNELAMRMEEKISALPCGYISRKNINGKIRYYLQWRENGKLTSKYIREDDLPRVQEQIEERRRLQAKLKELKPMLPRSQDAVMTFETNVVAGTRLKSMTEIVNGYEKRDCFEEIPRYLYGPERTRVCVVYGLRRTGKTTMLFQAIADMPDDVFQKTAYMKARRSDTMAMVNRDLNKLYEAGYRYVFLDEVTLLRDFVDSAALFSDVFVPMGMKTVLSGTDSLGFWIARDNELYDRERMIHTTFIPYREYSRLLGMHSVDEYIRFGGTLRAGELDFDDEDLNAEDASFRDDESTRRYIDTAICKNIQHSLECYEDGNHFRHLYSLYEAGELTGAINRIVEDMNHRFVLDVLNREFKSSDLGISQKNLRKERDPEKRTGILDQIDVNEVTGRLMHILEIRNRENRTIGITATHIAEIKEYLMALDIIMDCPTEFAESNTEPEEHVLFAQPGMRYCQAQALVHSLLKDDVFKLLSDQERDRVAGRILEEVRGRMLEDIVLLETAKALDKKRYRVFKLQFLSGEFDMVIYDREAHCCQLYEIKHSGEAVREQARHLLDEKKSELTKRRFGQITGKTVLYLGQDIDTEEGIAYRNAEEFLIHLPEFVMMPMLEEEQKESDGPMPEMF